MRGVNRPAWVRIPGLPPITSSWTSDQGRRLLTPKDAGLNPAGDTNKFDKLLYAVYNFIIYLMRSKYRLNGMNVMCDECFKVVDQYYPGLHRPEKIELLWGATSFPFGNPEKVASDLAECKANTDGTIGQAIAYQEKQCSVSLENLHKPL